MLQSTGSYNESVTIRTPITVSNTTTSVTKPLEEEFPLLCSGPSTVSSGSTPSQRSSNQVSSSAQWRIKERTRDDGSKSGSNQQSDNCK